MEHKSNTALLERPDTDLELSTGDGNNNEGAHELAPDGDIPYTHMIIRLSGTKKFKVAMLEHRAAATELLAICNTKFIPGRVEAQNPLCPDCVNVLRQVPNSDLELAFWVY